MGPLAAWRYRTAWGADWPGDDDEHVETVPRLSEVGGLGVGNHGLEGRETWIHQGGWKSKVGGLADESHRQHLDAHLGRKEHEDAVVERLQDPAADRHAGGDGGLSVAAATADRDAGGWVGAGLVHSERNAVEQDDGHADSFEPAESASVKVDKLTSRLAFQIVNQSINLFSQLWEKCA